MGKSLRRVDLHGLLRGPGGGIQGSEPVLQFGDLERVFQKNRVAHPLTLEAPRNE